MHAKRGNMSRDLCTTHIDSENKLVITVLGISYRVDTWGNGFQIYSGLDQISPPLDDLVHLPIIDIIEDYGSKQSQSWFSSLPEDLVRVIRYFGDHQYDLLRLCNHNSSIKDFIIENPGIFWYVIGTEFDVKRIIKLCNDGHRKIIQREFGTCSKSALKFFRKIRPHGKFCNYSDVIQQILRQPKLVGRLNHLPFFHPKTLELYTLPNALLLYVNQQIEEGNDKTIRYRIRSRLKDIENIISSSPFEDLEKRYRKRFNKLKTEKELRQFCNELNRKKRLISSIQYMYEHYGKHKLSYLQLHELECLEYILNKNINS
jgi:hypothetical protein